MTETVTTPEDEAKAAVREQYAMVTAWQGEYGWEPKILDARRLPGDLRSDQQARRPDVPHALAL